MTATIFLHDAATLRVSFPYSAEAVAAIRQIGGARWHPESRTWRVPLERLDALLVIFGDSAALAPEVVMAAEAEQQETIGPRKPATPEQRLGYFLDTLTWAGVVLRIEGERVQGSGGCWTPILQAEIDKRAAGLRRLLSMGRHARVTEVTQPESPPVALTLITRMDYVMAAGERNAQAAAERAAGYRAAATRRRYGREASRVSQPAQVDLFEEDAP